jgi:hypothetical protein
MMINNKSGCKQPTLADFKLLSQQLRGKRSGTHRVCVSSYIVNEFIELLIIRDTTYPVKERNI